jgi:hypothetical protein
MKFKGHDLAWGEAQAKDYVDNNYHKPSDEFHPGWDFQGLAKLASFGYELGVAAAQQPDLIQWLPNDEFEPARKNVTAVGIDGTLLFAGRSNLHPTHLEGIDYPPQAVQKRMMGRVIL